MSLPRIGMKASLPSACFPAGIFVVMAGWGEPEDRALSPSFHFDRTWLALRQWVRVATSGEVKWWVGGAPLPFRISEIFEIAHPVCTPTLKFFVWVPIPTVWGREA